jgi:predicted nucleic acid-binding protein
MALYEHALRLMSAFHYSFFDSLILAAAIQSHSKILYTEDLQNGQMIEGLRIQNPFV